MDKGAKKVSVGWFLYDPETEKVLVHQRRDRDSGDPKEWDYFGGNGDEGEAPGEALRRELCEELCIYPKQDNVKPLGVDGKTHKHMFYVLHTREDKKENLILLREGAGMGWFSFDDALKLPDLASDAKKWLLQLRKKVGMVRSNRATRAPRGQAASSAAPPLA